MTILASNPIANARRILNDARLPFRSDDTELLAFMNECLNVMVDLRPDLFVTQTTHTCTAGAEQTLALDRVRNIQDVPRIVGGAVVLPTSRALLDRFAPGWYTDTPAAAMNWMPHPRTEKFYVDPPAPSGQVLQVFVTQAPLPLAALSGTVDLNDNYAGAITAYIVNRVSSKDDESVNAGRAALFMNDFAGMIGVKPAANPAGA